jgi:adenosylcobyric acid synthase
MALNSYVTPTGGEIGYAQAVQAWAAGVTPAVQMNPILLKPQGDMTSQVILNGKAVGTVGASEYYEKFFNPGWEAIKDSLKVLSNNFDVVVCEGAGSPAEINLKHRDLTNMRIATYLNAPTILVVDIDRGGSFAHVVGTLQLLEPEERALIKGVVINKFRGQLSLLQSGIDWLEKYTGIPVLGVIPWLNELFPAEDSLSLLERRNEKNHTDLTIAVILLPRISNFTDFDPLEAEPTVKVKYIQPGQPLGHPDAVIIPGSKTTIPDLLTLQRSGMAEEIQNYVATGGTVLGICGGFQMLGELVADTEGIEGQAGRFDALNLLPLRTFLTYHKVSRQRQVVSNYPQTGLPIMGYEIHHGRSKITNNEDIYQLFDDPSLGVTNLEQSVWGTYLHGIFDNSPWRRAWLNRLRYPRGLPTLPTGIPNYREQRETLFNNLADMIESNLNMTPIIELLESRSL